jgi:hypothetical protein
MLVGRRPGRQDHSRHRPAAGEDPAGQDRCQTGKVRAVIVADSPCNNSVNPGTSSIVSLLA